MYRYTIVVSLSEIATTHWAGLCFVHHALATMHTLTRDIIICHHIDPNMGDAHSLLPMYMYLSNASLLFVQYMFMWSVSIVFSFTWLSTTCSHFSSGTYSYASPATCEHLQKVWKESKTKEKLSSKGKLKNQKMCLHLQMKLMPTLGIRSVCI